MTRARLTTLALVVCAWQIAGLAQDRLKTMPGYEQFQRVSPQIAGSVKSGALAVTWKEDGRTFEYVRDGRRFVYDVTTRRRRIWRGDGRNGTRGRPLWTDGVARPRAPFASSVSPDTRFQAFYRERNCGSGADGANASAVRPRHRGTG